MQSSAVCSGNPAEALSMLAGRSETMVEYDVGFLPNGEITALKICGYFLCGAFLDLGFNDMMVLQQGVDQVCLIPFMLWLSSTNRISLSFGSQFTPSLIPQGLRSCVDILPMMRAGNHGI